MHAVGTQVPPFKTAQSGFQDAWSGLQDAMLCAGEQFCVPGEQFYLPRERFCVPGVPCARAAQNSLKFYEKTKQIVLSNILVPF